MEKRTGTSISEQSVSEAERQFLYFEWKPVPGVLPIVWFYVGLYSYNVLCHDLNMPC